MITLTLAAPCLIVKAQAAYYITLPRHTRQASPPIALSGPRFHRQRPCIRSLSVGSFGTTSRRERQPVTVLWIAARFPYLAPRQNIYPFRRAFPGATTPRYPLRLNRRHRPSVNLRPDLLRTARYPLRLNRRWGASTPGRGMRASRPPWLRL